MFGGSVILLVLCTVSVYGDHWESVLPWQVKTTLLQLSDQFNIDSVRGDPIPIYREDLAKDYVAYWYILINHDEYLILSSGPETGDYKLVIQGSSPSLIEDLDKAASEKKTQCVKYFMVTPTPDVNVACQDNKNRMIFADNKVVLGKEDYSTLSKLWENQRHDVEREHVWENSLLTKFQNDTYFRVLEHGDNHKIVVGDSKNVHIMAMNDGTITEDEEQARLCHLLGVCHPEDNTRVNPQSFQKTKYGQLFVNLDVPLTKGKTRGFYLTLSTSDKGETKGQHIAIDPRRRFKRKTTTGPWTLYSINDENLFPDYNQHDHDCKKGWFWNKNKVKCCAVGCGPVAWAMILGYYDRRSHDKPNTYSTGSQGLFRCGADATTGSNSCKAPSYTTNRVKKLTENLNNVLGTFCLSGQGATTQGKMKRFENYFSPRQTSGKPSVTVHSRGLLSFVGAYNDGIRNSGLAYIRAKWPVVVGIRVSGIFSQHYPVATKYRHRWRKECKKNFWGKTKCKTSTEYEMYLHMGWGGSKNGWRAAKMFMAAVARY
ncbi:hypothetical protein SNE40_022530 [Patella caerulea]|uniref:Peptidase C1A papain C-terminal domain-containing protein n=1 Tax=Patella caerulea TaxID=87958 RepID=A0AAN8G480_PATCE